MQKEKDALSAFFHEFWPAEQLFLVCFFRIPDLIHFIHIRYRIGGLHVEEASSPDRCGQDYPDGTHLEWMGGIGPLDKTITDYLLLTS